MLINIFNRNHNIHEPKRKQRADISQFNPLITKMILKGKNCDELPNAIGEFGSITNPIPVNGSIGEIKYLGKLRGMTGNPIFFHRIGSLESPVTDNQVDLYELVCIDGTQWSEIFFDMYHPRRSNIAPEGFSLTPFNKKLGMDLPYTYGVNTCLQNFPYDIPEEIETILGRETAFSRNAKRWLDEYAFDKPKKTTQSKDIIKTQKLKNGTLIFYSDK